MSILQWSRGPSSQIFPMLFELDVIYLLHPQKTASNLCGLQRNFVFLLLHKDSWLLGFWMHWWICITKNLLQTLYEVLQKICICVWIVVLRWQLVFIIVAPCVRYCGNLCSLLWHLVFIIVTTYIRYEFPHTAIYLYFKFSWVTTCTV